MECLSKQDVQENRIAQMSTSLLDVLLLDRTTGRNIVWATDDYSTESTYFAVDAQIIPSHITGDNGNRIMPRVMKAKNSQQVRTRSKAEVFTPSWICNAQNNLVDAAWFGRTDVFTIETEEGWETISTPVEFSSCKATKDWKHYVDARRMEVTCGEAPYLVSRYDTVTGQPIEVPNRIGLLDRKLRVVTENTLDEAEWMRWSIRAYQSVYAFEFQGDNLLLARENMLATFADYMFYVWKRQPTEKELLRIATILSWNIWQMDGTTNMPPYSDIDEEPSLFNPTPRSHKCRIKDWRSKKIITYASLIGGNGNGK